MDSAIDKLIELAREKGSKKKTVTIVTVLTLAVISADPYVIAGLAALYICLQSILDYFNPPIKEMQNEEEPIVGPVVTDPVAGDQ